VYWFEVIVHGRIAHGSMPFLGVSAIEHMGNVLEAFRGELMPALGARATSMPVVPEAARRATLNVNTIIGGQANETVQSPCVADRCRANDGERSGGHDAQFPVHHARPQRCLYLTHP
jgi:succinyl-diaminopimelate desuccinylase